MAIQYSLVAGLLSARRLRACAAVHPQYRRRRNWRGYVHHSRPERVRDDRPGLGYRQRAAISGLASRRTRDYLSRHERRIGGLHKSGAHSVQQRGEGRVPGALDTGVEGMRNAHS